MEHAPTFARGDRVRTMTGKIGTVVDPAVVRHGGVQPGIRRNGDDSPAVRVRVPIHGELGRLHTITAIYHPNDLEACA